MPYKNDDCDGSKDPVTINVGKINCTRGFIGDDFVEYLLLTHLIRRPRQPQRIPEAERCGHCQRAHRTHEFGVWKICETCNLEMTVIAEQMIKDDEERTRRNREHKREAHSSEWNLGRAMSRYAPGGSYDSDNR